MFDGDVIGVEAELTAQGFADRSAELLGAVIYVLMLKGEPVYIGRSQNVIARMIKHRQRGTISFDQILVRTVDPDMASAREAELIAQYEPLMNVASTARARMPVAPARPNGWRRPLVEAEIARRRL